MGDESTLTRRIEAPSTSTSRAPSFLVIGRILGPVGTRGDVRAQIITDFPDRFERLTTVYVGDNLKPFHVQLAKLESGTVLLKLATVDDANAAAALRNADLHVPIEEAVTLPDDQFYWHQIVGLDVWTDDGRSLGKVTEVLRTGSNDVYVVGRGSNELLIPAIEDVIREIDLPARRITVKLLPGLEEKPTLPGR